MPRPRAARGFSAARKQLWVVGTSRRGWRRISWAFAVLAVAAAISGVVFTRLTSSNKTDILQHNELLLEAKVEGAPIWGYSAYYLLLDALSFGDYELAHLRWVAVGILTLAMALKAVAAFAFISQESATYWLAAVGATFVMLVVPLNVDLGFLYLGTFSGAIWHNSTTVVLMPASLALFWLVTHAFDRATISPPVVLGLAVLTSVNAALKPNYVLTLVPALGLAVLGWCWTTWQEERDVSRALRLLRRYAIVAVPATVVLSLQYVLTFQNGGVQISLGVEPFAVWSGRNGIAGIPWSLMESYLLPLAATLVLWRVARRSRSIQLAWTSVGVGVLVYATFAEYGAGGELLLHGNWLWGAHVSTFMVYVVTTALWITHAAGVATAWKFWTVNALAAAQFTWGLLYLYQLITVRNFL